MRVVYADVIWLNSRLGILSSHLHIFAYLLSNPKLMFTVKDNGLPYLYPMIHSLHIRYLSALWTLSKNSPTGRFQLALTLQVPTATLPMDLISPAHTLAINIANSLTLPLRRIPLIFHLSPSGIPHFSRTTPYQSFLGSHWAGTLEVWAVTAWLPREKWLGAMKVFTQSLGCPGWS
jgi:hypothetical protein